ncbi:MAG: tyrosine-type recombinase/integrase [Bacteroidales bacterium]|nr:tyrosine-type recombinase/integrase [Bacteroidales bacterium]
MKTTKSLKAIEMEWLDTVRECSQRTYRQHLELFIIWMSANDIKPDMAGPDDVRLYKKHLMKEHSSAYTINAYLTAVRSFYRYVGRMGYGSDIAADVKNEKANKYYNKQPLTEEQVDLLLASVDRSTLTGKRDYLIMTLMIYAGLRGIEVARMDLGDIKDIAGSRIIQIQRKGHREKDGEVPTNSLIRAAEEDYMSLAEWEDPAAPMFYSIGRKEMKRLEVATIDKMVKARMRSVGIDDPKYTTHSLRHTFGVMCIRAGLSLYEIQALMGHSSINTTNIYVKMEMDMRLLHGGLTERLAEYLKVGESRLK